MAYRLLFGAIFFGRNGQSVCEVRALEEERELGLREPKRLAVRCGPERGEARLGEPLTVQAKSCSIQDKYL